MNHKTNKIELHYLLTANPILPSPKTATVEPGSTPAAIQAAPTPKMEVLSKYRVR